MDLVSEWELLIFGIAAILTAAVTAVAGAGGGMVLLIVMLQFVDPLVAVPAHGVVQLFANGTRSLSLRSEVDAPMMRWFLLPLVPAMIVGFLLADAIPRSSGRAVVGIFALLAVWWPAATAWLAPKVGGDLRRFALVGIAAGILHPTIGAPGRTRFCGGMTWRGNGLVPLSCCQLTTMRWLPPPSREAMTILCGPALRPVMVPSALPWPILKSPGPHRSSPSLLRWKRMRWRWSQG